MFIRFSTVLPVAALAAVVAAVPSALEARGGDSQCNTGPVQCCSSTQETNSTTLDYFSGLFGLALPNVGALLGLGCTPITAIGLGTGSTCTSQAVCCTNNEFQGLINLGCSPINLSL